MISKKGSKLNGKWSFEYDSCIECGSTSLKHKGRGKCQKCYNLIQSRNYRKENPEKSKAAVGRYRARNKEKLNLNSKQWRKENPERAKELIDIWQKNNPEKVKQNHLNFLKNNPGYKSNYNNERMKKDIDFKLSCYLRSRLHQCIRKNLKKSSAVKDLGCTISDLKKYLEKKFISGMSWDNYGKWHVDHIYPLSKIDINNKEQLLKVCHYTNLQPLWAHDNLVKHNSIL